MDEFSFDDFEVAGIGAASMRPIKAVYQRAVADYRSGKALPSFQIAEDNMSLPVECLSLLDSAKADVRRFIDSGKSTVGDLQATDFSVHQRNDFVLFLSKPVVQAFVEVYDSMGDLQKGILVLKARIIE